MATYAKEDIKGIECKHVGYRAYGDHDIVLIKERIHLKDGTTVPNIRLVRDYQRDYYIAKPGYRKYTQKKTSELLSRLDKYSCNQATLVEKISRSLGRPGFKGQLRQVCKSPYVYGADIPTPVLIKQSYREKFPDCASLNSVAAMDTETDVLKGTEEILMISLTFKEKVILCVTRDYLGTHPDPIAAFYDRLNTHLSKYVEERNLDVQVYIADTPGAAVAECIRYAHLWQPDFITFWNIAFDMPRMIKALQKDGYDIGHVFTDPCVPHEYRNVRWIEASPQKVTASGKVSAPHWTELWHWMDSLASFQWLDSACVYQKVRAAAGKEPSYALDAILKKHLNLTKLKFDAVKHAEGTLQWHEIMQREYKIEYMVYNIFDNIAVELLDEKLTDLSATISVLNGSSEYSKFPSQPRRTCDAMHFFLLNEDPPQVIGTTSSDMKEELDGLVVSMIDWMNGIPLEYTKVPLLSNQ